jgi:hypothetical protein
MSSQWFALWANAMRAAWISWIRRPYGMDFMDGSLWANAIRPYGMDDHGMRLDGGGLRYG